MHLEDQEQGAHEPRPDRSEVFHGREAHGPDTTSLSISNAGFSKAVTLDDGGRWETDPGNWKEKSEMRRPISDSQAQASLEGGVQGWADGDGDREHRAGSVKLLEPPGRSEPTPDKARGTRVHVDSGKPPEASRESSMLAHLSKGFSTELQRRGKKVGTSEGRNQ